MSKCVVKPQSVDHPFKACLPRIDLCRSDSGVSGGRAAGAARMEKAGRLRHADRCWSSPALRAIQTAEALQLDAIVEPMLRECDYGRWSGRSFDEVRAQEPEALAEWLRDPEAAPHGGESIVGLIGRVAAWLETQNGMRGKTVAVTHASVIRAAIVHAIEASPRSFWRIDCCASLRDRA